MKVKRGLVIVLGLAVAVAAFIALRGDDDDSEPVGTATVAPRTTTRPRTSGSPTPTAVRIRIAGAEPVGGVRDIRVKRGTDLRLEVTSDVADEVHVHGYDISGPVRPGRRAVLNVDTRIEGIFEIELEQRAVPIAELRVEP